jgi:hypothetical protein
MDKKVRQEIFNWHMDHDTLFRKLAYETAAEPDDAKFAFGNAMIDLVLKGKVNLTQGFDGELLFSNSNPN